MSSMRSSMRKSRDTQRASFTSRLKVSMRDGHADATESAGVRE